MNSIQTFDLERWCEYDKTDNTYQVAVSYVNPKTHEWSSEIVSSRYFYSLLLKMKFRELFRDDNIKSADILGDLSYTKEQLWRQGWCKERGLCPYERTNWRAAKKAYKIYSFNLNRKV